jgi:hypothetical protein
LGRRLSQNRRLRGFCKKDKKKELLFVNKKKQKNFDFFDVALAVPNPPEGERKFFGSFF